MPGEPPPLHLQAERAESSATECIGHQGAAGDLLHELTEALSALSAYVDACHALIDRHPERLDAVRANLHKARGQVTRAAKALQPLRATFRDR